MMKRTTIVLFSGDYDKVMAAYIIANGAAAYDHEVTIFHTFWGLNALRKDENIEVTKSFMEKMFGKMMPRGADKMERFAKDIEDRLISCINKSI